MIVVGAKLRGALRTPALPRLVALGYAGVAEDVEALRQNGVLPRGFAGITVEEFLVLQKTNEKQNLTKQKISKKFQKKTFL